MQKKVKEEKKKKKIFRKTKEKLSTPSLLVVADERPCDLAFGKNSEQNEQGEHKHQESFLLYAVFFRASTP